VHLGLFGCLTKLGAKRDRTGAKVHAKKSHRNFSQLKHLIHPIGPQTHILVCFILFGCIWDPLVALQHSVQNGSNWCKSSCHKVALEFFAMNASDSPHWTLNSCFRAFCTIWVLLGLFGCLPILSAKHVKLVQKFVPRSRVGIFPTNAPDPPHWTLNSCSGAFHTNFAAFGTVWLARKNSVQNGPTGAKVRATKSRRKFSQRTHPILLIGL